MGSRRTFFDTFRGGWVLLARTFVGGGGGGGWLNLFVVIWYVFVISKWKRFALVPRGTWLGKSEFWLTSIEHNTRTTQECKKNAKSDVIAIRLRLYSTSVSVYNMVAMNSEKCHKMTRTMLARGAKKMKECLYQGWIASCSIQFDTLSQIRYVLKYIQEKIEAFSQVFVK